MSVIRIFVVLMSVLLLSTCIQDSERPSDEILIVINPWFPYELWDEDTQTIKGVTGEYVTTIFKNLGYTVKYTVEPSFDKALIMVATAEVDSIYSLLQTPERTKIMLFSNSTIIKYESLFLVNADHHPVLVGSSIYDYKETLVFGSVVGETESEATIPKRSNFVFIRTFRSYQELMKGLDEGIIDVALMEMYNGVYEFNKYSTESGNSFSLASTSDYTSQYLRIAFAPTPLGQELKEKFDIENEKMKSTNLLQELLVKYVGTIPRIKGYHFE